MSHAKTSSKRSKPAAAPKWMFEQIHFAAGRRGAVLEHYFYNKLESFSVPAGKRDHILAAHVQLICEALDTVAVIRSYCQQIHGSSGADAMTSIENLEEQLYL